MANAFLASCRVLMDAKKLQSEVARKASSCLYKAAAYLRTAARRKIRRRNKASEPGQPPSAHSGAFKASIAFAVDKGAGIAVIGPMRLNGKPANASGTPVPGILEFGGQRAPSRGGIWYDSKAASGIKSRSDAAGWFQSHGSGPLYWGRSEGAAISASRRGRKGASGKAYRRYSPVLKRDVWMVNARIETGAQAGKAAKVAEEVFGYPAGASGNAKVAARPFMGPALEQSRGRIAEFFRDRLV